MASSRERRIAKELVDIQADKDQSGVFAQPIDPSDLTKLKGIIPAPPDTPYTGGTYQIDIQLPDDYPFKPPIMRFDTRTFHPNISSQTGAICLDTLGPGWSPVQTIKSCLLCLRLLLENPNPKDPQDAEVAKLLNDNPAEFARTAHEWAVRYAGAPRRELDMSKYQKSAASEPRKPEENDYMGYNRDLIHRFVNMGFSVEDVVDAFCFVGIDRNGGEDYELEEAYMGDITARLLGEH